MFVEKINDIIEDKNIENRLAGVLFLKQILIYCPKLFFTEGFKALANSNSDEVKLNSVIFKILQILHKHMQYDHSISLEKYLEENKKREGEFYPSSRLGENNKLHSNTGFMKGNLNNNSNGNNNSSQYNPKSSLSIFQLSRLNYAEKLPEYARQTLDL